MSRYPEHLTIGWLREQYAAGLTVSELAAEIVNRAQRDQEMNIWITPPELSRMQPYIERLADIDPATAPLWGMPFAIKDNIDVAGYPTTSACPDYAYVPGVNATVVERLIAAGAFPIGKTNLDQFATGLVGVRSPYGETRNAYHPELISGGSSSGSAVAVAKGQAVFALGTDTAGSGRVPAALNGLFGYKPSHGAWSSKGLVSACASLDCISVFTNTAEDAYAVDVVVRGYDSEDPWSRAIPRSLPTMPEKLLLPRQAPEFFGQYADSYRAAWEQAVQALERSGIAIEYIDTTMFDEAAALVYEGPWIAERWAELGAFIEANPGSLLPVTEAILRTGNERGRASDVYRVLHQVKRLRRKSRNLLQGRVLVMPTVGGTWTLEQLQEQPVEANSELGRYTNHCNVLHLAGFAVPAGWAEPGLPFGLSFFALPEEEGVLFGAQAAFHHTSLPQVAAAERSRLPLQAPEYLDVAVCGLHMRGLPLETQMRECGARFIREAKTAPAYRLFKLHTVPAKPGLIRDERQGDAIVLELWRMPTVSFGAFVSRIPAPLGIGKVELEDGSWVSGFVCESYASEAAEEITRYGGWRAAGNG